jgi:hypothetical protein
MFYSTIHVVFRYVGYGRQNIPVIKVKLCPYLMTLRSDTTYNDTRGDGQFTVTRQMVSYLSVSSSASRVRVPYGVAKTGNSFGQNLGVLLFRHYDLRTYQCEMVTYLFVSSSVSRVRVPYG